MDDSDIILLASNVQLGDEVIGKVSFWRLFHADQCYRVEQYTVVYSCKPAMSYGASTFSFYSTLRQFSLSNILGLQILP